MPPIAHATSAASLNSSGDNVFERGGESARAVSAESGIDGFEASDEIDDISPGVRAAGGTAKVGAASERPVLVDHAAGGAGIQQWTGSVGGLAHGSASGGAEGLGGKKGLPLCQERDLAGLSEAAATGAQAAVPGEIARAMVFVDGPNGGEGFSFEIVEQAACGHT